MKFESYKKDLTIIVTTSIIDYHPNTELIEIFMRTLNKRLNFYDVKKIITCDECLDQNYTENYKTYKNKLKYLCETDSDFLNCKVIEYKDISKAYTTPRLQDIIKDVLENHITTPVFMQLQHDFSFVRNVDITPILKLICEEKMKYLMLNYKEISNGDEFEIDDIFLTNCNYWAENAGICLTSYYPKYVYPYLTFDETIENCMNYKNNWSQYSVDLRPHFFGKIGDSPIMYHMDGGVFPNKPRNKYG